MVAEILAEMTAEYQSKKMQSWWSYELVALADSIWPEVVLSDEEKSRQKGGDAVNVCDFAGAVAKLAK